MGRTKGTIGPSSPRGGSMFGNGGKITTRKQGTTTKKTSSKKK